jgi:uncharacterized protein with PQ loop repeat
MRVSPRLYNFFSLYMTIVGWAGHFIFFFQAYKIISTGSAKDVSLPGFLISLFSVASWLFYGIITDNKVLVRVNIFGLIGALICVGTILLTSH